MLAGLVGNAALVWWWADSAAGYAFVVCAVREVRTIRTIRTDQYTRQG